MYEHCFKNFSANVRYRFRKCKSPLIGFLGEVFHPLGLVDLRVTMGRAGRNKTVLMEFAIVKCHSPYNVIMGRTGMRSLRAVGSTIHSMIKFPTDQGVVIMETSKEALWECRPGKEPILPKEERDEENMGEKITICSKRPDQCITIRSTLSICCKQHLTNVLRKHVDVFAWIGSEGTTVPRFVMEHQLKTYPLAEPVAHRKRPLTPDRRQALKEKVFNWLKEGIIRRVQHPEWVTNATLFKLASATWQENSQIRMVEDDEEKTRFHTEEGVYCFTHMPRGLKNSKATLQRMIEKVLADQQRRNVEVYLEEIIVKSKSEQSLVEDVEETLNKLRRVNVKIDPSESTFGMKEGRFIPKLAELMLPIRKVCRNLDAAEGPN
ncbi:hypothetical protein Tco_0960676 [Tanacetum coccineum]